MDKKYAAFNPGPLLSPFTWGWKDYHEYIRSFLSLADDHYQAEIERLRLIVDKYPKCWRLDRLGNFVRDMPIWTGMACWDGNLDQYKITEIGSTLMDYDPDNGSYSRLECGNGDTVGWRIWAQLQGLEHPDKIRWWVLFGTRDAAEKWQQGKWPRYDIAVYAESLKREYGLNGNVIPTEMLSVMISEGE